MGTGAGEAKSDSDSDFEEESESGLLDRSTDVSVTTHLRSRQMNAGNLDAKIVKALKKQEEKREKRATRKKEVIFMRYLINDNWEEASRKVI